MGGLEAMRTRVDQEADMPATGARAGGGGGGGLDGMDQFQAAEGTYSIAANKIQLMGRPPLPPAVPEPSVITILAAGLGVDGLVNVRGSQGVRVTSGPPPLPETGSSSTNGIEILTG